MTLRVCGVCSVNWRGERGERALCRGNPPVESTLVPGDLTNMGLRRRFVSSDKDSGRGQEKTCRGNRGVVGFGKSALVRGGLRQGFHGSAKFSESKTVQDKDASWRLRRSKNEGSADRDHLARNPPRLSIVVAIMPI